MEAGSLCCGVHVNVTAGAGHVLRLPRALQLLAALQALRAAQANLGARAGEGQESFAPRVLASLTHCLSQGLLNAADGPPPHKAQTPGSTRHRTCPTQMLFMANDPYCSTKPPSPQPVISLMMATRKANLRPTL